MDELLKKHRDQIDAIDEQLLKLVNERAAHARQIGEIKGGSRAIRTVHHRDGLAGQVLAWVESAQLGVVPLGDGAHKDFGQHGTADPQLAWLEPFQVHDRHGPPDDGRKLHQAVLVQLLPFQRGIGGTKCNGFRTNLTNTARRTYGLIVQTDIFFLFVGLRPLSINRIGECGASTSDVGCLANKDRSSQTYRKQE